VGLVKKRTLPEIGSGGPTGTEVQKLPSKGRIVGFAIAIGAAVALGTAGLASGAPAHADQIDAPQAQHRALTLEELKTVLVPRDEQPTGTTVSDPMTLRDAAAYGALGSPQGMTSSPASCLTFVGDAIGDASALDGWIQFGMRDKEVGHAYSTQLVVNLPGGADVGKVAAAAETCAHGTLTLEGTLTGDTTFAQVPSPRLAAASTYDTRMTTTFPTPTSTEEQDLLTKYNFHEGACPADYDFVAMGSVLIWSLDPDPDLAQRAATIMHDRTLRAWH
jgi:hypothetical protein